MFRTYLKKQITQNGKISFSECWKKILKSKVIEENKKSFITKTLRKAIMRRSALKKKANNLNDPLAVKLYKNQNNYVVNLSRKVKKDCFQKHMQHSLCSENFWKFYKLFFTNQITNFDHKTVLVEKEKIVSKNEQIAYLFNTYFHDITKGLNIERWQTSNRPCKDPPVSVIRKYEMHPSILKIKSVFTSIRLFDFNFVNSDGISKIITSLDLTKVVLFQQKLLNSQRNLQKFNELYQRVY